MTTFEGCAGPAGTDEPLAGNYFVSTYPPFSCWTQAGAEEYRARLSVPRTAVDAPLGLYVHIPFCVDRCHYCYYLSHDDKLAEIDAYADALARESGMVAGLPAIAERPLSFVYFGGGTPSLLSTARIERLFDALQSAFVWSAAREVTFECAPRSVTEPKLRALRDRGVTRISLGVQQMDDAVLRANGRVHLVADVETAYARIRRIGFDVVNLDLIVGLVDETEASFRTSLDRVIALGPDSVTIYQLEIPLNTPLWRSIRDGALEREPASWDVKRDRLRAAMRRLEDAGYTVRSAYAAVRDPIAHRFAYQVEQYHGADLLGLGSSAFSHVAGCNQQNQASLAKYLEAVGRGDLPLSRGHACTDLERAVREFVLQLKLGGAERQAFLAKFGVDLLDQFGEPLADFERRGWLQVGDDGVRVTREGSLRVDRMLPAFYLPEHRGVRYS